MTHASLRLVLAVARGVAQARTDLAAIASAAAEAFARELGDGAIVVLEQPSALVRVAHRDAEIRDALERLAAAAPPTAFPGVGVETTEVRQGPDAEPSGQGEASPEWAEHCRRFPQHRLLLAPIRTASTRLGRAILIRDRNREALDEDDVIAVHACLEQIAFALEHAIDAQVLEKRERQLTLATNAMKALVYDWDLASGTVSRSAALHSLLGYHPEEVPATAEWWRERIHPDDGEPMMADGAASVAQRLTHFAVEYRIRHRDGRYVWVWDHLHVEYDDAGRPVRMVGCTIDIEERKRAEQTLRSSEERVRKNEQFALRIIDNLFAFVAVLDTSGTLIDTNQAPLVAGGVDIEDVRGKKFWDCYWWSYSDEVRERIRETCERVARGEIVRYDAVARIAGDGRLTVDFQMAPLFDDEGRITHLIPSGVDVTERKRVELELRNADRRKDQYIAILAHELRNPLAPVSNAVQILRRLGPTDPWVERARDVIERQVTHMARLIDDLLDVSRVARGTLLLQTETCDVAAIARQAAEDHRASLDAAGLALVSPDPSGPVWVEGDPVRLAQMIGNLLHNARRFTDPGGRVEVRTEVDPQSRLAVVSVKDTGVGIEPGLLSRLFDPFSQADQDLARSKGGLGLGLALTKGLAELHGGGVAAQSDGPGRGSTFSLRIPLSKARHPATWRDSPTPSLGRGLRILVVEDNEDAAETLGDLLELGGHVVRLAFDGAAALAIAKELRPHVVISDIGLPGELDGYAVARTLRADPTLEGTFLVALSGYANEDARRRSREAGFDVHFAKPPDIARLEQTLAGVASRR